VELDALPDPVVTADPMFCLPRLLTLIELFDYLIAWPFLLQLMLDEFRVC